MAEPLESGSGNMSRDPADQLLHDIFIKKITVYLKIIPKK